MFKKIFIDLCNQRKEAPSAVCMKLGLSNATFSCWTDSSVPRRATLERIADYFGVTVDYLIGNEDVPASTAVTAASGWELDEREQTLLTTFRSTTEEGRQLIIQSVLNIRDDIAKRNTNPSQDKAAK